MWFSAQPDTGSEMVAANQDCKHIAACDPTTIAEIVTKLIEARAEIAKLKRDEVAFTHDYVLRHTKEHDARIAKLETALREIARTGNQNFESGSDCCELAEEALK